jgi:hypothetical protein
MPVKGSSRPRSDHLLADGVIGIVRIDQGDKVGVMSTRNRSLGRKALAFAIGQVQDFFEIFQVFSGG